MTENDPKEAVALLREFRGDVIAAYGTGTADDIDEYEMGWPDMVITYRKVCAFLRNQDES